MELVAILQQLKIKKPSLPQGKGSKGHTVIILGGKTRGMVTMTCLHG